MKKRVLSLSLVLALCVLLALPAYAADTCFVYDDAGLLSGSEAAALESKLQEISAAYNAQIAVVTIPSLEDGDVDWFVEHIYDEMGFGYGNGHDGVLLLVCMDPREYRILSNGFAAEAISMNSIDTISGIIVSDLSDGYYADAFDSFAEECRYYLDGHINGFPFEAGMNLLIALVIGLVAALIGTGILRGQLKSVRQQRQADAYIKPGSMQITQSGDYFMYRNITRTQKQTSSSSSSSSGSSRNVGGGKF